MNKNPDHSGNLAALKRIEGQVRGIGKMISEGKYCIDILTQIHAVKGALARVEEKVLEKHFKGCVSDAFKNSSDQEKEVKMAEILELIRKTRK